MAVLPERRPSHNEVSPQPSGLTAPRPVTTTEREVRGPGSGPDIRVATGGEASFYEVRKGADRGERIPADLVTLGPGPDRFLGRHHEAERLPGVKPETFAEQRGLPADVR